MKDTERIQVFREQKFAELEREIGFLTRKQIDVLVLRGRGFSQREIGLQLRLSRSSVSMIEHRARIRIEKAKQTLQLFEQLLAQTQHLVTIDKGTHLQKIPMIVLSEGDRYHVHIQKNMVEILKMVKKHRSDHLSGGKTVKKIRFSFNERGKLSLLAY